MAKKRARGRSKAGRGTSSKVPPGRRICNIVPSKGTDKDWRFRDAVASGALGAVAAPPSSVDLRAAWWAIDDQEDTGSCVGWATAEGVVRYHMVKADQAREERPALAALRVDGLEGDRRVHGSAGDVR